MNRRDTFTMLFGGSRNSNVSLLDVALRIWDNRNFIIKWEIIGIIVGLIISLSIPKEYETIVKIAPEKKRSLINLFSEGNLSGQLSDRDAYSYRLYPEIVNSQPFMYNLLEVSVPTIIDDKTEIRTIRELLDDEYKLPWWEWILDKIKYCFIRSELKRGSSYMPAEKDLKLMNRLKNNITLVIMDRTHHLELEVKMQDPLASAALADTITNRLIKTITEYRNQKKNINQYYIKKMFEESRLRYNESCLKYANYVDSNHNLIKNIDKLTMQRLDIERTICFNDYQMNSVNFITYKLMSNLNNPLFYIFEPATVAVKSSYPRKLVIISYCMFFFGYFPLLLSIKKK